MALKRKATRSDPIFNKRICVSLMDKYLSLEEKEAGRDTSDDQLCDLFARATIAPRNTVFTVVIRTVEDLDTFEFSKHFIPGNMLHRIKGIEIKFRYDFLGHRNFHTIWFCPQRDHIREMLRVTCSSEDHYPVDHDGKVDLITDAKEYLKKNEKSIDEMPKEQVLAAHFPGLLKAMRFGLDQPPDVIRAVL